MDLISKRSKTDKVSIKSAKQKILYQVLFILLLTSIIPLAISDVVLIQKNKVYLEDAVLEVQNRVARNLSSYIEQFVRNIWGQLQVIAKTQISGDISQDAKERLMGFYLDNEAIVQIYVQSEENVVWIRKEQGTDQLWNSEYVASEYPKVQEGIPVVTHPYQSENEQELLMTFLFPLVEQNFKGVLAFEVSLKPIMDQVAADEQSGKQNLNVQIGKRGFAYIVDSQGRLLAHPDRNLALQQKDMTNVEIVGDYFMTGVPIFGTIPFKGRNDEEQLGSYSLLTFLSEYGIKGGLGWGIIVQEPKADAYRTVRQMRNITIAWGIGTAILATFLAIAVASTLTKPIRKFVISAMRIARGNFKEKVDVKSSNEIGQLAETFNYMTGQLEIYDKEMKNLFLSTVKSLVAAIDAKDPYTKGHSERVTRYSMVIGEEMGLSDEDMEKLHIGGLLHDIGKIAIIDQVLNKQARFTDEERKYMRTHPARGAEIMKPIRQLEDIIPIMKYHHEWWDGNGYPDGLKGEEIPFLARIVCLADTYDAMTTDRPYQKGMKPEFVLEKVQEWSGTRYDPNVVEAFTRAFKKGKITNVNFEQEI